MIRNGRDASSQRTDWCIPPNAVPAQHRTQEPVGINAFGIRNRAIEFVLSVLGADRVMYAMDYPYQFVPEEVAVTDGLKIGAADLRKLYQTNAERVFKL